MVDDINKSLLSQFYGINRGPKTLSFSSFNRTKKYDELTDAKDPNEKLASATRRTDKNQHSTGDTSEDDENDENNFYKSPHVLTTQELVEEPDEVSILQEPNISVVEISEEKKDPKAPTRLEDTLFKAMFKMSENPVNQAGVSSDEKNSSSSPSSPVAKAKTLWRRKTMISKENLLSSILSRFNGTFLNLNKSGICTFPVDLLDQLSALQMLYLDSNSLTDIPEQLFVKLKDLKWLDVRNNQLTSIPSSVKGHACLETLLLQGNNIKRLPLELGLVPNLKNLQVAHNPLVFPPQNVLDSDCTVIVNLLRNEWNKTHPNALMELKESPSKKVGKRPSTILCYGSASIKPSLKNKSKSFQNLEKMSVRSKSWNYKPSNRCQNAESTVHFQQRGLWIATVRKLLSQQAAELQKSMSQKVLNEWRRSSRFQMRKSGDISRIASYSLDTPFALHLESSNKHERVQKSLNLDEEFKELMRSLNNLNKKSVLTDKTPRTRQRKIEGEMNEIIRLLKKLQNLRTYNDSQVFSSKEVEPVTATKYTPSPPVII
ncbi:hypothetical protein QAD02_024429 [Eretmocerus hayati]|uniref:Uncharacterized protein n=1 Tax=Eretmocerus hayati TaxID=131215 RepID=A0ACC2PZB8_9HYME|nr:hypothetical protein QAD02_024429 [Eretmocerus hayati]